jgi:hypothetical protein
MNMRNAPIEIRQRGARPQVVTVVGTSCAGKTRTLYEAVNQILPDWTLVKPTGIEELTHILYTGIPNHTVVWLDELQDFLTTQGVEAAEAIHKLLQDTDSPPILFAATIWPSNVRTLEQRPDPAGARAGLGAISKLLRDTVGDRYEVPAAFRDTELGAMSLDDPRIAKAVQHAADGQLIQVLAGGTQLVHRVYPSQQHTVDVFSPAARAVILAAADLRRIGYPNLMPRWAIEGAAPGYLEASERRRLNPSTWIQNALDEAAQDATRHHNDGLDIYQRGVPALTRLWVSDAEPTADPEHYELHDYLLQHHLSAHRHTPTAANLWNTVTASDNLSRLTPHIALAIGEDAELRGLYSEALTLFTVPADKRYAPGPLAAATAFWGNEDARKQLAKLLARRGDVEGLRSRADQGDSWAERRLVELLAQRGDVEGVRSRADQGDSWAERRLVELLAQRGDVEGVRSRADQGDSSARNKLIELSASRLARLLAHRGDIDGLQARADQGDWDSQSRLAILLAERGDVEQLRTRADQGDSSAQYHLPLLLLERGDVEDLRRRADQGGFNAKHAFAVLLAKRGDVEGLRARADQGDLAAQHVLMQLLVERADEDGLWDLAGGYRMARENLAELLGKRAAVNELKDLVHATFEGAADVLIRLYQRDRPDGSQLELDVNAEPRLITQPQPR